MGKHEEILVDKVVYLDGITFGERMVERKDGHEPVSRKGNLFELRLDGATVTDEGQVNVLVQEHTLECVALALDELNRI